MSFFCCERRFLNFSFIMEFLHSDICGIYSLLQADDEDGFSKKNLFELTRKVFMLHREKEFILFFIHESGEEMMKISTIFGEISEVLAHPKVPVKKLDRVTGLMQAGVMFVFVSSEAREELKFWQGNLVALNGRDICLNQVPVQIDCKVAGAGLFLGAYDSRTTLLSLPFSEEEKCDSSLW